MHIQEASSNTTYQLHWGYVPRQLPCANDAGSCEYLDAVYGMHDTSMLYTFILWAVIGGVIVILGFSHTTKSNCRTVSHEGSMSNSSLGQRLGSRWTTSCRRLLLPEGLAGIFGHISRLQILLLSVLLSYLLIFSLVGIVYKTWITPVKSNPTLHNTRTGLGGFADRVGALDYALTPFTVALGSRESVLSLLTGIPYTQFNFLHRWLGRVMLAQALLHTFGWTLIEARLYQPQPSTWKGFVSEPYIIWGWVALGLMILLFILSLHRVVRLTGHEFFRKAHYILAGLYFGACWAHWDHLACWMIASLGLWLLDRGIRLLRTALLHIGYLDSQKGFGFRASQGSLKYFDDDDGGIIRLEFDHNSEPWSVGQHYFLTFPTITLWQSHPFTTASVPSLSAISNHSYIIRCRKGETQRLKALALDPHVANTPVIMCGPYGPSLLKQEATNILAIAGGTGISLILPLVLAKTAGASSPSPGPPIDFVWIVRRSSNMEWIAAELELLRNRATRGAVDLRIYIYVTQDNSPQETSRVEYLGAGEKPLADVDIASVPLGEDLKTSQSSDEKRSVTRSQVHFEHPSLKQIIASFVEERAMSSYRTRVIASGPASMGHDLRAAVAAANDGGKVWKGNKQFDVDLHWDDRMG